MQKKILILLSALVVAFVFCGAASAATVKTNHVNTVKIIKVQQNEPVTGDRVVWTQYNGTTSSIYCKNIKTGDYGKVFTTTEIQYMSAISGTRVVWQQYNGTNYAIYCKNLATGEYGKILTTTQNQSYPSISGTRVVWSQYNGTIIVALTLNNGGEDYSSSVSVVIKEPGSDPWVQRTAGMNEKPIDNQFYARDDQGEGTLFYNGVLARTAEVTILVQSGNVGRCVQVLDLQA